LVGTMLGIFIIIQLISIVQAYYTARVGNRVMGDLRIRLFSHLQSMELAFFTRTKTGVIQSRLNNDVGGVAGVLSNTISSVIGNSVTVISAFIAMVLLSWQLTIIAFIVLPLWCGGSVAWAKSAPGLQAKPTNPYRRCPRLRKKPCRFLVCYWPRLTRGKVLKLPATLMKMPGRSPCRCAKQ